MKIFKHKESEYAMNEKLSDEDREILRKIRERPAYSMELKPCPFCGCHDVEMKVVEEYGPYYDFYGVVCNRCKTKGPQSSLQETATYLWNTRYTNKEDEI